MFTKPPDKVIRKYGLQFHQYMNDSQFYFSFPPASKGVIDVLDQCLESAMSWMRVDELKHKLDKIYALWGLEISNILHRAILSLKSQISNWGAVPDTEKQVTAVVWSAFAQLQLVSGAHSWFSQI